MDNTFVLSTAYKLTLSGLLQALQLQRVRVNLYIEGWYGDGVGWSRELE